MKHLRTVSTRRLLAMIAGLIAAIAAGTAIAVAATAGGPVPPAKPLARAVHDALAGPAAQGITARITFTNHLINSSNIQGVDPLLTGATGRLWLAPEGKLRLELQASNGDAQVLIDNRSFWVYDPTARTVYEGTLPALQHHSSDHGVPSVADIQGFLTRLMQHVGLSTAIPSDVAGQAAYTVRISPRHDGGLLGRAELAWDAVRGVPLRIAVYARGDSSPVLELKATDISYGKVSGSVFKISPPSGAKVVRINPPASGGNEKAHEPAKADRHHAEVAGVAAVARKLSFKLTAPARLVGLPRRSVSLVDFSGEPAALVTYGQNLGGVAVLEQPARSAGATSSTNPEQPGLHLPTVSIGGVTAEELDTPLGTLVRFTRGGVTYTVVGSVPPAAADAAARAL